MRLILKTAIRSALAAAILSTTALGSAQAEVLKFVSWQVDDAGTGEWWKEAIAAFLSACTVSFNNFSYKGMEPGEPTYRAFYLDKNFGWAAEKMNRDIANWGNVIGDSSTTS